MWSSPLAVFPFQYRSWDVGCFCCLIPLSGPRSGGWPSLTWWRDPDSSSSGPAHAFTPLHRQVREVARKHQPTSIHPLQRWENRLWPRTAGSRDFYVLQKTTRKNGEVGNPLGFESKTRKKTDWLPTQIFLLSLLCPHPKRWIPNTTLSSI